jgi:hypothetical protein
MFKEKSSKKRITTAEGSKDSGTLDARHQTMILQIQKGVIDKDILKEKQESYKNELTKWKLKINNLHKNNMTDTTEYENAWLKSMHYTNCLRDIRIQIENTLDEKKEIEYYENTANILFEYYNLIENQESMAITTGVNVEPILPYVKTIKGRKKYININQKSILEAFQIKEDNCINTNEGEEVYEDANEDDEINNTKLIYKDKTSLVEEYMLIMDANYIKNINNPITANCQTCNIPLTCVLQEGIMICTMCGYQELLLVEQNRPIYRQTNKDASNQSYKRINHFTEWVNQIQGKESTEIPEEIFEKIVHEIKKEKIKDTHKLSYNKMREILKKLKFNKYYEHIYYIIYRLNGISPPNFSPELEDTLRNMFKEIQGPFLKHCPFKRKNFLSYSYVLFKFCQLLEKDEYLQHFSLLKSREKLHIQDQIWRNICAEVKWEFIQSI